ncbi:MAG: hypothetical protein JWO11_3916 [Nocardioides sp.]|nr:hypothetical protein [Nocardioides sp.]
MSAAEKLERAVREAIDAAPPLTDEQREAAAHLLRSASTSKASAA